MPRTSCPPLPCLGGGILRCPPAEHMVIGDIMAKSKYHCKYIDFDSGFAPICNSLRAHPAWHSLTPVTKNSYAELVARYFDLGRPKDFFACPHSSLKDKISRPQWVKSVKSLANKGFIELRIGYKYEYKLSNSWKYEQ